MHLPWKAKAVIATAFLSGAVGTAWAVRSLGHTTLTGRDVGIWVVLAVLALANWFRPLVIYRGSESEAVHLDEGLFVIAAVILPWPETILTFAGVTALAQLLRRRPLSKSLFNCGQMVTSAGAALLVSRAWGPFSPRLAPRELGAVAAGAAVFFVVNSAWMAAILGALATPWRSAIQDGLGVRLLLLGASVIVGLSAAAAAKFASTWTLPIAIGPLIVLRVVLAGHFHARHDHTRLRGLFRATLQANQSMGVDHVVTSVVGAARDLLRCPEVALGEQGPGAGELGAALSVDGHEQWLVVSGRSRTEPFDEADGELLNALAAVGSSALANADLYEEGLYQRERLAAITASLAEGVCAVDRSGGLTFVNPAAAQLLGWENTGIEPRARANRRHAPPFLFAPASRAMESGQVVRSDSAVFERRDGTLVPVAFTASVVVTEGRVAGAVIAFSDITERKAFEEELSHHAFHDALTGLANRRLFIDHLDHALSRSVRSNETHAVLFADIDRFKIVNDNLGHRAGDELLSALAERLGAAMRPGDMLARFGGDEFAVLLEGIRGLDDAVAVAERMAEQLLRPIVLDGSREVVSTLSVGIALTAPGKSRDDLLRDADVAMYEAKIKGRSGRCAVYDQAAMGARSAERFELEGALRKALERQELEVFYQPLFASEGEKLIGAEALVRWRHPEKGLLGPQHFISLAEETGLILPLGQFVLEQACRDSREWQDRHGLGLSTSVNLSPRQFQQHGLAENISSTLRAAGIDPRLICLEITETLIMEDVDHTVEVLGQLKQLGVRLAIDDFGTGYSSLGYLKKFPIDVVKIDRTFVEGLGANPVDTAIVASVIELAKALRMVTVAEGVETDAQLSKLRSLGCPVIQGFLLAEPMPSEEFAKLAADASREPLVPAV